VPGFVWIALAVFLAGFAGGLAWAGGQALRAWWRGKASVRRVAAEARGLSQQATELGKRADELGRSGSDLASALDRLSRSLARARLLLDAAEEAKLVADRVRWLVPRK